VVAGEILWGRSELKFQVTAAALEGSVYFPGYIDEADIADLYHRSDLVVYPSLYEGFGLPVIEAMACGVPVITTGTSSMPEVAGDAAVIVNPHDSVELANAITRVLTDAALRSELRVRGIQRANQFTEGEAARKNLQMYEEAHSDWEALNRSRCE
jgi:glycosyltransferase involved in cell wall biosynthesis